MRYRIIFIVLLGMLTGCKTKKLVEIPERTDQEIIEVLDQNHFDWEWFEYKGKIKAKFPDESFSGTMYLRMQKDSIIWMMVKKMSVEVVRALITPEEATVLDRIKKTYFQTDIHEIFGGLPYALEYSEIQKMLTGQIINITEGRDTVFEKRERDASIVTYIDDTKFEYIIDLATMHIYKVIVTGDEKLEITYKDYKERKPYGTHPSRIEVIFTQDGKEGKLYLKTSKLTVDVKKKMPFGIPSRYKRIER